MRAASRMRAAAVAGIVLACGGSPEAGAAPPADLPAVRYAGPDEVKAALDALAGPRAKVAAYGKSAGGRDLLVLRVGSESLPQVLVSGGVGDRDAAGTAAALDFARRVLAGPAEGKPDPLEKVGFLVVPAPNPDALAGFLDGKAYARGGGHVDRDQDGKAGEDGPNDVDGDGEILWMRRKTPAGPMAVDDAPPAADGKRTGDPRLVKDGGVDVRRAASYERVVPEGKDDDGDGDVDEDPPGLDVAKNFLGDWTEHGPWRGEGPFPGSAPEARALMELSYGAANLVAWYEFASEGPRLERASEHGKDADADDATYGRLVPAWKEACGLETRKASERPGLVAAPSATLDWAAVHLGALAVRVPVWRVEKDPTNARERQDPDELDWLLWNDRVLGGKGFVPWHEVAHPQWGTVEIGGWHRFTRYEPPADLLESAVRRVSLVPAVHAAFAPRLDVIVETTALGGGLARVRARASNVGGGPTENAVAVKAKRSMEVRLAFAPASGVEVVAGPKSARAGVLAAGATSDVVEWTVRGAGTLGRVEARHRVAGTASREAKVP